MSVSNIAERNSLRRRADKRIAEIIVDGMTNVELRANHDILVDMMSNIQALDAKIIPKQRLDSDTYANMEELEDECDAYSLKIKVMINTLNLAASDAASNGAVLARVPKNRIELPKITLPEFHADNAKDKITCKAFIENFEHLVGQYNLNELELFNLLERQCNGRAKVMISSLQVVNQTYQKAKDILLKAFAEEMPQKFAIIKQLNELHFEWGIDDPYLFYAKFSKLIDSTKQVELKLDEILLYYIWNGLPGKFQDILVSITNKSFPELKDIKDKFLESCTRYNAQTGTQEKLNVNSFAASMNPVNDKTVSNKLNCKLCSSDHSIAKCTKYSTPELKVDRLKQLKLCLKCFQPGHFSKSCNFVTSGKCMICKKGRHWSYLCQLGSSESYQSKKSGSNSSVTVSTTSISGQLNISECLLPLLTVCPVVQGSTFRVNAMFDSGSQNSFVTSELAQKLNLKIVDASFKLIIRGINSVENFVTQLVEFQVKIGDYNYVLKCICLPTINIRFKTTKLAPLVEKLRGNGLQLAYDDFNQEIVPTEVDNIKLLLGARDWAAVARLQSGVVGKEGRLTNYLKVDEGYILMGSIEDWLINYKYLPNYVNEISCNTIQLTQLNESTEVACNECVIDEDDCITEDKLLEMADDNELEVICRKFLNIEVNVKEESEQFDSEAELNKFIFENSYRDENGMHIMAIPWISRNKPSLCTNEKLAHNVLKSVLKKHSNTNVLERMNKVFQSQIECGMIEKIVNFDKFKQKFPTHSFLSHFPVVKDDRQTSKVRVVYMANLSEKSKDKKLSLNQCVHPGFNKSAKIADILNRCRFDNYLLIFDISKAYHRLGMTEENAAHFLFYWFEDVENKNYNPIILKCNRIVFGMNVSPYLLQCCLYKFLILEENDEIEFIKELKRRIYAGSYVDNFAVGCNTLDELNSSYNKILSIFLDNKFPLQQFVTNSVEFQNTLDKEYKCETSDCTKLLGMEYNRISDTIRAPRFQFNAKASTKREVISTIKTAFDLQNINIPVLNRGKLFLQSLQRDKDLKWDEKLSPSRLADWKNIVAQVNAYIPIAVPRCIGKRNSSYQIITLCDASKDFIGCVIYVKDCSTSTVSFISAHNRVLDAQSRLRTMPVLELSAIEYAVEKTVKFYNSLTEDIMPIKINNVFIFSDSTIALSWISKAESSENKIQRRKIYVNNRISSIVDICTKSCSMKFTHIGTHDNTADYVTRQISPKKLASSDYISGPRFLQEELKYMDWIQVPNPELNNDPGLPKFTVSKAEVIEVKWEKPLNLAKFSSLHRAVKVLQTVYKFINRTLKKRIQSGKFKPLSEEYKDSEAKLIEMDQREVFDDIYAYENSVKRFNKNIPPLVSQMNIVRDSSDNLLKVKSKMEKMKGKVMSVKPILLSSKMNFTRLLILNYHKKFNHSGVYFLLHKLKKKYFILKAYSTVKKILDECYHCKRFNARVVKTNTNAYKDWNVNPPKRFFAACFVDGFGPYNVWYGGEKVKAYGILFKCVWSKMVNIEIVLSQSSKDFLTAYQNHIYAYGISQHLISDEGSNFTSTFKWISECLNNDHVKEYFADMKVEVTSFENYPPGSLNRGIGGFIESGVGLVKKLIQGAVRNNVLEFLSFQSVMKQCICYANKRPITQQGSLRSNDEQVVITPEFLKLGYESPVIELPYADELLPDVSITIDNIGKLIKVKDSVRAYYNSEFLYSLVDQATKYKGKYLPVCHQKLRQGDIVLIKDTFVKAANYPLARVVNVKKNTIDESTVITLVKGNKTIVNRDISSLILLVRSKEGEMPEEMVKTTNQKTATEVSTKPRRVSALKCLKLNKELIDSGSV